MKFRVGYELIYDCPQPTPMILTLNIHYSRAADLWFRITDRRPGSAPAYRDGFGNWCSRIVAPAGRSDRCSAIVRDTGPPDEVVPALCNIRAGPARGDLWSFCWAAGTAIPMPVRNRLEFVRAVTDRLGARSGDLRFRPPSYRVRLRIRPFDPDRLGSLQRAHRRLPRLCASRHRVLPVHEHSGTLLHRLSERYRQFRRRTGPWTSPAGSRRISVAGGTPSTRATTCRGSGGC